MILFGRIAGRALIWLAVIAAALACCQVAAWSSNALLLSDAAKPLPACSAEHRGPTAEEVIEQFNRKGPEYASPPGVVE